MPLDREAYKKKMAEHALSKQPMVGANPAEKSKKEKRTKAKEDRKRPPPTDLTATRDAEGTTSRPTKQFKVGGPVGYPSCDSIFVPDWGLKVNESVTIDVESTVKFMRGMVHLEDYEIIHKYDPSHLIGLLAMESSTALFLSNEITTQLFKLVEVKEANEKKINQLEDKNAAAESEVENARATLQRIDQENVQYKKQNGHLRKRLTEKKEEWKAKEKEHMDGNLLMYSLGWMELREKAKEKYPDVDLSDIPSDFPLDETPNEPSVPEESDATRVEVAETQGQEKAHTEEERDRPTGDGTDGE